MTMKPLEDKVSVLSKKGNIVVLRNYLTMLRKHEMPVIGNRKKAS